MESRTPPRPFDSNKNPPPPSPCRKIKRGRKEEGKKRGGGGKSREIRGGGKWRGETRRDETGRDETRREETPAGRGGLTLGKVLYYRVLFVCFIEYLNTRRAGQLAARTHAYTDGLSVN